ncbi:hypothetical protein PM082_017716 [Marasmius tenuissimus]|nr:hypothetical protein PM082_017716 [Marasmius tenuissimus]
MPSKTGGDGGGTREREGSHTAAMHWWKWWQEVNPNRRQWIDDQPFLLEEVDQDGGDQEQDWKYIQWLGPNGIVSGIAGICFCCWAVNTMPVKNGCEQSHKRELQANVEKAIQDIYYVIGSFYQSFMTIYSIITSSHLQELKNSLIVNM